jgi:hypothetical protein
MSRRRPDRALVVAFFHHLPHGRRVDRPETARRGHPRGRRGVSACAAPLSRARGRHPRRRGGRDRMRARRARGEPDDRSLRASPARGSTYRPRGSFCRGRRSRLATVFGVGRRSSPQSGRRGGSRDRPSRPCFISCRTSPPARVAVWRCPARCSVRGDGMLRRRCAPDATVCAGRRVALRGELARAGELRAARTTLTVLASGPGDARRLQDCRCFSRAGRSHETQRGPVA